MNQQISTEPIQDPKPEPAPEYPRFTGSEETKQSLLLYYLSIPNTNYIPHQQEKEYGLRMAGVSEKEIQELCEPKDTRAETMVAIRQQHERELRKLDREERKRMKQEQLDKQRAELESKCYP